MPELCRFFGIVIRIYFRDHNPAHFHAEYGDREALIEIESLAVYRGDLPRRALAMVIEWASLHPFDDPVENPDDQQRPKIAFLGLRNRLESWLPVDDVYVWLWPRFPLRGVLPKGTRLNSKVLVAD